MKKRITKLLALTAVLLLGAGSMSGQTGVTLLDTNFSDWTNVGTDASGTFTVPNASVEIKGPKFNNSSTPNAGTNTTYPNYFRFGSGGSATNNYIDITPSEAFVNGGRVTIVISTNSNASSTDVFSIADGAATFGTTFKDFNQIGKTHTEVYVDLPTTFTGTQKIRLYRTGATTFLHALKIETNPSGPTCTITSTISPEGAGSVSTTPAGPNYAQNTFVTVTATANRGYEFTSWGGNLGGTNFSTTLQMDADKTITANFTALPERTVSVSASGCGDASATISDANEDGKFFDGDVIKLNAVETATCKFVQWSDGDTDNPRTHTVSGNASFEAEFESDITAPSITGSNPEDGGFITLPYGSDTKTQTVVLTYDEDIALVNASLITLNDVAITSTPVATDNKLSFDIDVVEGLYTISIGAGAVADLAGNITDGAWDIDFDVEACDGITFTDGSWTWDKSSLPCWIEGNVNLRYVENYTSDACNNGQSVNVLRTGSDGIAFFNLPSCGTFTAQMSATGGRNFKLFVDGVEKFTSESKSNICTEVTYAVNSCVPVVVSIQGFSTGTAGESTISAIEITDVVCYSLDLSFDGNGSVTADPDEALYPAGTVVTLTATPEDKYQFAGWEGANGSDVDDENKITMDEDKEVVATFGLVNSINNANASKAIASQEIFTLAGVQISEIAGSGVYIQKITYEDGSVETVKIVK